MENKQYIEQIKSKFPVYWTYKLITDFVQRQILVQSYLYYERDNPDWTDRKYDKKCQELVILQSMYTRQQLIRITQYGYVFYDFDGTTGFYLWDRLKEKDKKIIISIARK